MSIRRWPSVGSRAMPKRKKADQQVEIFDGAGVSRGLELVLAPGTASGYSGVRPSGSKWAARYAVEGCCKWRYIGTFDSPQEAAVQVALVTRGDYSVASPPPRKPPTRGVLCPPAPLL